MKKITAIFFAALYLLSTTEAHQLLKLPVIFEHFREHKNEDHSISLLRFLDIHYMHGSPRDKDYDRDMQLPFKTADDCIACFAPVFEPVLVQHEIPVPVQQAPPKLALQGSRRIRSSYSASIWQPPKSC